VRRASIALVVLLAAACANVQMYVGQECDTLYFGTQRQDAGVVSDGEWRQFLAEVVTPRFPDGLTWWHAEGQWRDTKGAIEHERTYVLQLVHSSDARVNGDVAAIVAEYKRRFAQESVLQVRSDVWLPSSH
jgi:hypothetical protein